ncbi:MAG: hypothetical protein AAF614_00315 [Chloroflexota bacterium]
MFSHNTNLDHKLARSAQHDYERDLANFRLAQSIKANYHPRAKSLRSFSKRLTPQMRLAIGYLSVTTSLSLFLWALA